MIYISGRITGNKNWMQQFADAEKHLKKHGFQHIKNPLSLGDISKACFRTQEPTYREYMITDIMELVFCDYIYMLKGWRRSKGARLEHKIAKTLGMKIIYQK